MVNRLALGGLAAISALGGWLIAAPFVLRFQASGAPWTNAARIDIVTGAILVLAGFSAFFTALAGRITELYAEAEPRTASEPVAAAE
jgi:hypothetical protein